MTDVSFAIYALADDKLRNRPELNTKTGRDMLFLYGKWQLAPRTYTAPSLSRIFHEYGREEVASRLLDAGNYAGWQQLERSFSFDQVQTAVDGLALVSPTHLRRVLAKWPVKTDLLLRGLTYVGNKKAINVLHQMGRFPSVSPDEAEFLSYLQKCNCLE